VVATEHPAALAAVTLLLARGASPTVKNADSPLGPALSSGNEPVARLLLGAGAELDAAGPEALPFAIEAGCAGCADLLIGAARPGALDRAITALLPPFGDGAGVPLLLAPGASPTTTDKWADLVDARGQRGVDLHRARAADPRPGRLGPQPPVSPPACARSATR
jgi:hypothetical protein